MSNLITYPEMRLQVVEAVRALSDLHHQRTRWGRYEEGVNYYDDLALNVHILYDDCMVLPAPQGAVPGVLHAQEVQIFRELDRALGPMLDELRGEPDDVYVSDPRWPLVVETAARALVIMEQCDEGTMP
ncbi:hypothetical protein GCM10028801_01980 [Nocardioides maradonensis]